MLILFTDETNLAVGAGAKFFAYGGLILDTARLPELHEGVENIRREAELAHINTLIAEVE